MLELLLGGPGGLKGSQEHRWQMQKEEGVEGQTYSFKLFIIIIIFLFHMRSSSSEKLTHLPLVTPAGVVSGHIGPPFLEPGAACTSAKAHAAESKQRHAAAELQGPTHIPALQQVACMQEKHSE